MTEQDQTYHELATDATQVIETPAAVQPVTPPSGPPKSSRARWVVALGGAAAVVAITAAIVFALVGKSPNATVLGYVPAGSIVYGELRMDLPGDQAKAVGAFLSKFPGFADQAALETKIDEALDKFIATGTDKVVYTRDIKPWFEGEFAFSVGALPDAASISGSGAMPEFHGLALLSLKDGVLAKTWFDKTLTELGAKVTTEAYGGTTITISTETGAQQAALAIIDGKVAVVGDLASVKAAIDTKGAGAFANEAGPKAALGAADSDHLGLVYVALKPLMDWSTDLQESLGAGAGAGSSAMSDAMLKSLPAWGAYWVRAEADAFIMEAVAPKAALTVGPTEDRPSEALKHVPSTAVAVIATNDTGKTLVDTWAMYKAEPSLKEIVDQVEKAANLAGGVEAIVGWMGDTAIVVDRTATSADGGIVVVPTDAEDARQLLTSLKSAIGLAGAEQGITIREEDHNGVTITIVDAGEIAALAGSGMASIPPGFKVPDGHIEIAWAATDQVVVIGSGPDFVKRVLDTTEATSIASNARFKALADRGGKTAVAYFIDLAAIREMSEGLASDLGTDLSSYEQDVKPYLTPFDALYAAGSVGGDLTTSTFIVTVK